MVSQRRYSSGAPATDLDRRRFNLLLSAALGGIAAGAIPGCGGSDTGGSGNRGGSVSSGADAVAMEEPQQVAAADIDPNLLAEEPHVCRGLNTCKNMGKSGENACAGQGACATVDSHICNGANDCKGRGGCGEHPGQNACEGKGACAVPLTDKTWETARAQFEEVMAQKGIEVGPAPSE